MRVLAAAASWPIELLTGIVFAVGCAHNPEIKPPPPPASAGTGTGPTTAAPEKSCSSDADCGDRQLCIRSRCLDITAGLAECSTVRVHFDFDRSDIHREDRPMLERIARCLRADQALHVTIEGNADERGTEEYDLALGDRRATAVARYLEQLLVSPAQLKTITYGKERPLCIEHDEECWSKNRRTAVKPH